MNSTPERALPPRKIESLRILSFNVNNNYLLTESLLNSRVDDTNILFLQEPPWKTIRQAPSTVRHKGNDVVGAPLHPEWMTLVRPSDPKPRVMAYVHSRLSLLRPSLRFDLVNDRDVSTLSLHTPGGIPS